MAGFLAPIQVWKDVPLDMYDMGIRLAPTLQECIKDMSTTDLRKYAKMWRKWKTNKQITTGLGVGMYIAYQRECERRGVEVY